MDPRLTIICEGPTEENFVNQVLGPHFYQLGFWSVTPRVIPTGKKHGVVYKGGAVNLDRIIDVVKRSLRDDPNCLVSTLVDLHGFRLPSGHECGLMDDAVDRAECIEQCLKTSVDKEIVTERRFIPYLQIFELEALLFADLDVISNCLSVSPSAALALKEVLRRTPNPEQINGSDETTPTRRLYPLGYAKPLDHARIAAQIGLDRIRHRCPRFNNWLSRIEALAAMTIR